MATRRTKKHIKRRKTRKQRRKRGGCGCNNPAQASSMVGGSSYSFSLPSHTVYPQNTYGQDPQASQTASRLLGGSSKKRKHVKKGGSGFSDFSQYMSDPIYTHSNDPVSSVGSAVGASTSYNVIMGHSNHYNAPGIKSNIDGSHLV